MAGRLQALPRFAATLDNSWVASLRADPESEAQAPNRTSREVKSGHYVPVRPSALGAPRLVALSSRMAGSLGLREDDCDAPAFAAFFSGDMDAIPGMEHSWVRDAASCNCAPI